MNSSFYLYIFRKYVSYGLPIIRFLDRGVHYETPCIYWALLYKLVNRTEQRSVQR